MEEQKTALWHVTVLEVTNQLGEYCGKLLADMGTEVIRIEPPGGHPTRRIGPFVNDEVDPNKSIHFFHYNANKKSITLDVEKPEGQQLFKRLIAKADILVESMDTGYLDGLGLGYEQLKAVNPGLVMVSISAFGRTGPKSGYKGNDLIGWAASGYMYTNGHPHTPPVNPWGFQATHAGCLYGAIGAMSALFWSRQTGRGQHVDVSLQESAASTVEHSTAFYVYDGVVSKRRDNDHVNVFGHVKIIRCKDGWAHMMMGWHEGRNRVAEWMAEEGMAGDLLEEKWLDEKYRRANIHRAVEQITKWAMTKTRAELFHQGQERDVEVAPINRVPDVLEDPQLKARNYWQEVQHPELAKSYTYPGAPYHFQGTPWSIRRRAPFIGEDNEEIYEKELGLSRAELTTLAEWKVI